MFDKLLDLLTSAGSRVLPFRVVPVAQHAGVLRFGRYHRTCPPGFHWKIPFVEEFLLEHTSITTLRLQPQTLTTADGVSVVVQATVKYQITDVEKYLTQVWDQVDVLADVSMGAIRRVVCGAAYDPATAEAQEKEIIALVRKQVNEFGFKIYTVTFTDIGRIRSIRLITHSPLSFDN
jgi:regulator of protease activity HflC (stomatin/prohibitin superfamily)